MPNQVGSKERADRSQRVIEFLPALDLPKFYSRSSGLIALEGPRGPLLARYASPEPPDRSAQRFLCQFPQEYTVFEGEQVPSETRSDVSAIAFFVDKIRDPRHSITSGTMATGGGEGASEEDTLIGPRMGVGMDAPGIRISRSQVEARGGSGGLSVSNEGVAFSGKVRQEGTTSKGVTAESPVWAIVPKSFVTFFASDYLPDLSEIMRLSSLGLLLAKATRTLASLSKRLS